MPELNFMPLVSADLLAIRRQPSQRLVLGFDAGMTEDTAALMASQKVAWSAWRPNGPAGPELIACLGIYETVPERQGTCWAVLSEGLEADHLALTRFARERLAECPLPRLEALAMAADIEATLSARPELDAGQAVALAMLRPSPECRWAELVGLRAMHLLRRYGPADDSVMLCERIG